MTNGFAKWTVILALAILALGLAPSTYAAQNMLLCINDVPGATTCAAGTNWVEMESDGTTLVTTHGAGASVTSATTGNNPFNIVFVGSIGSTFRLTVDTGTLHYNINPLMDLAFQDTANGAGTLNIFWGGSGFTTANGGPFTASVGGTNNNSSVTATDCIENTTGDVNSGFFACGLLGAGAQIGSQTFTASAFSAIFGSNNRATTSPFGLLEEIVITSTGAGGTSGDSAINAVPEPTSVLLLGGVLLITFRTIKRKMHAA